MKASEREKFGKFLSVLGIMEDFQEQFRSNETWLAVVLKKLGWKLQRPVRTIKYEDF